jgi:hypothetical protein
VILTTLSFGNIFCISSFIGAEKVYVVTSKSAISLRFILVLLDLIIISGLNPVF